MNSGNESTVPRLLAKFAQYARRNGVRPAIIRLFDYLTERRIRKQIFAHTNIEDRFTTIYETNYWGSGESVSGTGSTAEYTANLRRHLPALFTKLSISSVFDAPCGDFGWMRLLLPKVRVSYVGGDIVRKMIQHHIDTYARQDTRFVNIDITRDTFPKADIWICRDCLFHLSLSDIRLALERFIESGIPYVLTTTHKTPAGFVNADIRTGDFRLIDLFQSPFLFPTEVVFRCDDYLSPDPAREMCLWTSEQIADVLSRFKA